jgi:GT2 family glycosyltransferase/2-polyprenyl-3-methyl-5-hydroxy-6-metoxy-1,4-benzoquinol methylase
MPIGKVAIIYDDQVRPDTTGGYCKRALRTLVEVEHFLPSEIHRVPRKGFDLYLNIDDSFEYRLPTDLRPCAWWAIDTHINCEWYFVKSQDFDFVFTAQRDGSHRLRKAGISSASWLPLACDPEIHRPYQMDKTFDFCFIGHLFAGPRTDLVQLLQQRFPSHFVGERYFEEMAKTYSASRVIFNRSIRNDINMRVFEALACGSLLMTNDLSENGQADLFRDGVHLATYQDAEELVDKISFYLNHEGKRERIAAAGRAQVLAKNTYRHRMEWLLRKVESGLSRTTETAAATLVAAADGTAPSPDDNQPSISPTSWSGVTGLSILAAKSLATDLPALVPLSARKILVLGYGAGILRENLNSRDPVNVEALDLDDMVGQMSAPSNLDQLLAAYLGRTSSQDFDAIVCHNLLQYLRAPLNILGEVRRRLKPDGTLVVSTPTVRHHGALRGLLGGDWPFGPTGLPERDPIRFFTRRLLEKTLYRAGFSLKTAQALPGVGYDSWQRQGRPGQLQVDGLHVRGLAPEDAEEFFASHIVVRATPLPVCQHGLTSIVIVTHNQVHFTQLCLDSIRRYTDEPYELIVVDNGSTDGTLTYLRSLGDVNVIENCTNLGFPAGANQGIRAATGQQVLLLNNDTWVTTGWLGRMLHALFSDPDVGLVGPSSNWVSGEQQVNVTYEQDLLGLESFAWDWGKAHDQTRVETQRLVGFCLLMRREVIERVGLLDERFGIGCFEDDDYSRRAIQAGYRLVIARDAFVHHFGGQTFLASGVDYSALLKRNRELYRQKWEEKQQGGRQASFAAVAARLPAELADPGDLRVLVVAHVDRLRSRMDKSHYYRYEALSRRPGVFLFGPGMSGYRPGLSVREAVELACAGVWPNVILHGADLKESGVPLLVGLEHAPALTAIELLDSWAREDRQVAFINRHQFALGLIQEAGRHVAFYRERCPGTEFFWTPNAVNTQLFRNHRLAKEYDVILYGAINPEVYPLRARLARLLNQQPGIRFRHIPHPGYYPPDGLVANGVISGEQLSQEINRAWIGIATCSVYRCLLMKYLEIPASFAAVAGDMPEHGRSLFGDDFIELAMGQSDEQILGTLRAHLAKKDRLLMMTEAVHPRVIREYSTDAFADRVLDIFRETLAQCRSQAKHGPLASSQEPAQASDQVMATASRFTIQSATGGGLLLRPPPYNRGTL